MLRGLAAALLLGALAACDGSGGDPLAEISLPAPPPEPDGTRRARPWFSDATLEAGLTWTHEEGGEQWDIRPTMGPGAAFADVDGDGDEDLYLVGGRDQTGRLMLNDGKGRFADATAAWGLARVTGSGMGALFADWDDDGDPDLYVTHDGPNVMWRNDGERFTDVTAEAGTGDAGWSASAAFADVDRDGDLDLFVTNYLRFDLSAIPPESTRPSQRREDPIAMLPYVFPGQADVLYRNDGDGTFSNATEEAGLHHVEGKGLGAIFLDHDDDGWPDLYVANDTTPNTFWHNEGDGTFEEVALWLGLDDPRGGMGLAAGDVDADGDEDLLLTNWQLETNALYRNNHVHAPTQRRFVPAFEDIAIASGLGAPSVGYVGWGCALADLDNDGDLDVVVANGYTSPDYETTMICVGQHDQLFENVTPHDAPDGHRDVPRFRLVPPQEAGGAFHEAWPSRGLAVADVDGDGDLDLLVTANNGPVKLLRNENGGRSLRVVPEGDGEAVPRDAVGAKVTLNLDDGSTRLAVVRCGESYLSGNERGVRFGLGAREPVSVQVRWPDGRTTEHPVQRPGTLRVTPD